MTLISGFVGLIPPSLNCFYAHSLLLSVFIPLISSTVGIFITQVVGFLPPFKNTIFQVLLFFVSFLRFVTSRPFFRR